MNITGGSLVNGKSARDPDASELVARNAATGTQIGPPFKVATLNQLETACDLADDAFDTYRETSPAARADFLDQIARNIVDIGDSLIERAAAETGLPRARLEGERHRTCSQMQFFANEVRRGRALGVRIDTAPSGATTAVAPDLRLRHIPLGPVAVFGASNFPLAFSVAGGDTAAAFAAGCTVIVKAHPAHPGTSELVGQAIQAAIKTCGLPAGTFALLFDSGHAIGQALVAHRRIKAVGFTGSRRGGMALMAIANNRAEPIPVFAEMSSINPVILLPQALHEHGVAIANAFVAALTQGVGQFCTNPGLILAIEGPALEIFLEAATSQMSVIPAGLMLTADIARSHAETTQIFAEKPSVAILACGAPGNHRTGRAGLFATTAEAFMADPALQQEMFGPSALVVRCPSLAAIRAIIDLLEGQLTASIHMVDADYAAAQVLLPRLERKVGRIVVNGFGTGVAIARAMVHGGPFPATSDGRTTSVGGLAIDRFLRPICYQDMPEVLLSHGLRQSNPWRIERLENGVISSVSET